MTRLRKGQIQFMVQQQLRLRTPPAPADAADGIAVALAHCFAGGVHAGAIHGAVPPSVLYGLKA
jgi:Holliday junction resolvasome RuvABC endonuclease subunit